MQIKDFPCPVGGHSTVPPTVCIHPGVSFPQSYTETPMIAKLSLVLKELHGAAYATLPVDTMLELEALGGDMTITDDQTGPLNKGPVFASAKELAAVKPVDVNAGRLKSTLDAVKLLAEQDVPVCWNLHGPFTVLNGLMETSRMFMDWMRAPEDFAPFFAVLQESLLAILHAARANGAAFFSYGDAVGGVNIVGPKVFSQMMEAFTLPFLKRLAAEEGPFLVHLCPKTSTGLAAMEKMTATPRPMPGATSYSQALLQAAALGRLRFAGHRCINSSQEMDVQKVYELQLVN